MTSLSKQRLHVHSLTQRPPSLLKRPPFSPAITYIRLNPRPMTRRLPYTDVSFLSRRSVVLNGGAMAFYSGEMDTIFDDLALVQPTMISTVPTFFNKVWLRRNHRPSDTVLSVFSASCLSVYGWEPCLFRKIETKRQEWVAKFHNVCALDIHSLQAICKGLDSLGHIKAGSAYNSNCQVLFHTGRENAVYSNGKVTRANPTYL